MDNQVSIQVVFVSIITSFIGSWLFFNFLYKRQKSLKQKIEELEYEERFLDRISKGNIQLLRSAFKSLFFALALSFFSCALLLSTSIFNIPELIAYQIKALATAFFAAASLICFSFFRSLLKINNLSKAKQNIKEKKDKLNKKLNKNV